MTRLLWLLGFVAAACMGGGNGVAESLSVLDLQHPELVQPVTEPDAAYKFVQVDVVEVTNPARYALTFVVEYQPSAGARTRLGEFSLYPADNPGRFLVPALGKVRNGGTLVLRMTSPDRIEPGAAVRASVRRMRLQ